MWRQDGVSAPLTLTKVIDQIVTSLTDAATGFTVYDDLRANATPYVVLRNNRGQARDMYLMIQTSTNGGNTRVSATIYEAWNTVSHTGVNGVSLGYREVITSTNALLNTASTPDMNTLAFWFKQSAVSDPFMVSVFEPHRDGSGNLLNVGDDGSGWPQWGGMSGEVDVPRIRTRMNRKYNRSQMPSTMWYGGYGDWDKEAGGLWLHVTRNPTGSQTYQLHINGQEVGFWNSSENSRDYAYLGLPKRRCAAWAGSGAMAEGFPPMLWTSSLGPDNLHEVDWRGHLGVAGGVLMTQEFGGAPEDSFEYNGSTYRIVLATRGYNESIGNGPVSLAVKVA